MIQRHYGQSVSSSRTLDVSDGARIGNTKLTVTPHQRSADAERYRQQLFAAVKSAAEVNQPRLVQDPSGRPVKGGHPANKVSRAFSKESAAAEYRRYKNLDLAFEHAVMVRSAHYAYDTVNPLGDAKTVEKALRLRSQRT